MSNTSNRLLRAISLLILLVSIIPVNSAEALAASAPPPVDMFQLPWDQGIAWYAIDGIDNGSKRPASSSHNYRLGGAIDFAPRTNMTTGENTANYWVTAAADGTVVATATCYVTLSHANGWLTQYQFLGNIQVKLGDVVTRNQRLGVIADGVKYKYCPGYQDINIPHLHFMLRPSVVGATFAGWLVNYNSLFNTTTFTKNRSTVGLNQALMNVFDVTPTPTPTLPPTTITPPTEQPPTSTPTPVMSPTATLTGPYVSTTITPQTIDVGGTSLVTVKLNNVPPEGYTSAEFTCSYNANLFEASNITIASLFGADPATAINGPQAQSLLVAIAGSNGNKATTSGTAFTFDVKGLQIGQTVIECRARVSQGNDLLTEIPFVVDWLTIQGSSPTPNLTPSETPTLTPSSTPTPAPAVCDQAEFIADVNVPPGTQFFPGAQFIKTWRLQNIGTCTWTTGYQFVFFSGEQMSAPTAVSFPMSVGPGQTADFSIQMTAPTVPGNYRGYWMFKNASGALFGTGPVANEPWFVDISVMDSTAQPFPTSTFTPSPTPNSSTPTPGVSATPGGNWLTFTNNTYGFMFGYPGDSQIVAGGTDNNTRFNLPFVQGTNLREKYLEMIVAETSGVCQSPLASSSILQSSETVVISGITFLKQTGGDAAAGNFYQWVAYSTSRNNVCVSLDFVLHSLNPGNFATPIPTFDYAAESAVFGQIASTYSWLAVSPTSTATNTPSATATWTPTGSSNPTFTPTSAFSPTPAAGYAAVTGQITANKPVVVNVYDQTMFMVATAESIDGNFRLEVPPGTYTIVAISHGFLSAQATVTLTAGNTLILPPVTLLAGDIDGNNVIDQFDALTIGMNYNSASPAMADLNNDGIINVLDLEALAKHYRETGPIPWQ